MKFHARQNGVTVLEILVVLVILTFTMLGASSLIDNYTQQTRMSLAAQQMNQFGNAVQAYIKDNYQYVAGNSSATLPLVINASTLTNSSTTNGLPVVPYVGKYLPPGFNPINNYNETICALVLHSGGTPTLTTDTLAALVVTENGTAINDLDLGQLAGLIGAAGGAIYSQRPSPAIAPNVVFGTMGKWAFNITSSPVGTYPVDLVGQYFSGRSRGDCTTGHLFGSGTVALTPGHPVMALWFNSDTSSAYLYRNQVPGHPELNSMQTNLVFDNINNSTHYNDPNPAFPNPSMTATMGLNNISVYTASGTTAVPISEGLNCGNSAAIVDHNSPPQVYIVGSSQTPYADITDPNGLLRPAIRVGTLGADIKGSVLSCQDINGDGTSLKWTRQGTLFWGDPVDCFDHTNPGTCSTWLDTTSTSPPSPPTTCSSTTPVGVTHVVMHPTVGSNPRAYTCQLLGGLYAWQPLAADDQGILQLGSPPPSATERKAGDTCSTKGIVSMNSSGQLLTCQNFPTSTSSLLWVNSSVGNFHFYIQGYPNDPMVGVGVKNVVNGKITFSGTLHCDPNVVYDPIWTIPHQSCGSGGTMVCTNNNNFAPGWGLPSNANASLESCAYYNAMGSQPTWANYQSWDNYGYSTMPLNIDVVNLQVEISQPMIQTW